MEVTIPLASREEALALFGLEDRNLKLLRDALGVKIASRNRLVRVQGDQGPLEDAAEILESALHWYRSGRGLPEDYVEREIQRRLLGQETMGKAEESSPEGGAVGREERSGDLREEGPPVEGKAGDVLPGERVYGEGGLPGEGGAGTAGGTGLELPSGEAAAETSGTETSVTDPRAPAGRPALHRLAADERRLLESLPRSRGQRFYTEAMLRNEVVFCTGPAGTGKTFLAVSLAVHFLRAGAVRRLVLCRPAVEAGEKLGFLPGDFQAKINPYLRPLYDALNDVLGFEQVKRYLDREIIEIIPLAYMRGRTLNNAFIILDEGQNTTISQMKMFLTRMGSHSRIIVNGDITQVDLPAGQPSGMIHAQKIIRNIKGIVWIQLKKADIVRHPLVQHIIEAYESSAEDEEAPAEKS